MASALDRDADAVRPVLAGTIAWLIAGGVLLLRRDDLADSGRLWWLWVPIAGAALGLVGLALTTRRRRRLGDAAIGDADDLTSLHRPRAH
jgi:hypothetical protein